MSRYRTPLSRARGLGAAGHGAGHWISERLSAIALVPLVLWVVYATLKIATLGYDGAVAFIGQPLNAVLMVLLLGIGFWHMHAGMRVVVEDYIETMGLRLAALVANFFVAVLAGGLAIFSILKIALGGGL
ncbi:MAG: succinate dehydrogenase, hydrophobic membrane anchor protein [Caulobacter sp.]|jgi:succinate dehydrogenase / fumarate reductase membrane anchor subunit